MFAEDCPVEDRDILNDGTKCKDVTNDVCQDSTSVRTQCCVACKSLTATPWLGPNCPNGDSTIGCHTLDTREKCLPYKSVCCETCCPILGADPGHSCTPSTTSTEASAHTTTKATVKVTTTSTTTTKTTSPTLTTTKTTTKASPTPSITTTKPTIRPSTFKSTSPSTPLVTTTNRPSANRTTMTSITTMISSIEPSKETTVSVKTVSTSQSSRGPSSQKVTTDVSKVPDTTTMQRPNHKLLFQITIRISRFMQTEFDCKDPDLQDQKSTKYLFFNVSGLTSNIFF